jgi:hypothetical protein
MVCFVLVILLLLSSVATFLSQVPATYTIFTYYTYIIRVS